MSTEPERVIHNGVIIDAVPGVQTVPLSAIAEIAIYEPKSAHRAEDTEPEMLAAAMAKCIAAELEATPSSTPMGIVNALLKLTTARGHKVVWTRFDIHQLFALWTNKQQGSRR